MSIFVTGDTHGSFSRIENFTKRMKTNKNDLMIILGDVGVNYFGDEYDLMVKEYLASLPITFMFIHGNHEMRPKSTANGGTYLVRWVEAPNWNGYYLVEPEFPSLLFAMDGEWYDLGGKKVAVYGGAYSVDKHWRLATGAKWFPDEQMTEDKLDKAYDRLVWAACKVGEEMVPDVILSHTCPYKYIPREMFLPGLDQSTVDNTMERWFDRYDHVLPEKTKWYCGHWHTDKVDGRMRFMYNDIIELV